MDWWCGFLAWTTIGSCEPPCEPGDQSAECICQPGDEREHCPTVIRRGSGGDSSDRRSSRSFWSGWEPEFIAMVEYEYDERGRVRDWTLFLQDRYESDFDTCELLAVSGRDAYPLNFQLSLREAGTGNSREWWEWEWVSEWELQRSDFRIPSPGAPVMPSFVDQLVVNCVRYDGPSVFEQVLIQDYNGPAVERWVRYTPRYSGPF